MSVKIQKVCDDCGTSMVTEVLPVLKQSKEGCFCGCPEPPKFTVLSKPPRQ